MSKTLTLEKVNEWHPCTEAINWAEPIWNWKEENSIVVLERLIEEEKCDWANWLIVRVMGRKQYLAYAIFAAEQVLEIYETKYPKDERPRKAIESAKVVLDKDVPKNRVAASAARAAAYAAYAAYAVVNAVADAVVNAAVYAAYAAYAVVNAVADAAARAAAYNAYAADARKKMQLKILNYGMELLKK